MAEAPRKRKHEEDEQVHGKARKLESPEHDELDHNSEEEDEEEQEGQEDKSYNPIDANKKKEEFRNYKNSARQKRVANFYKTQHTNMTYAAVEQYEKKYLGKYKEPRTPDKGLWMGIWEALEYLDQIIDDSDPDTNLTQVAHALQTAEAIREKWPDEEHDWFPLTGLIHDLGKILAAKDEKRGLSGEPQWAVVGDTFPVGLPFSDKIVFPGSFCDNPDVKDPRYNQGYGVYKKGCGLSNIKMCWGHDEYMYQVCLANGSKLPVSALYMIRYHSFYPWHKEGAYRDLMDDQDKEMLKWVLEFNQFDLYSKAAAVPDVEKLKPYYQKLIRKYFPEKVLW
jgi:inositol oxygenase